MLSGLESPFQNMPLPKCATCEFSDNCVGEEAALRHFIYQLPETPAMSQEQRDWCLAEISCVEGWDSRYHVEEDDASLAKNVLYAWADYTRDKGLM